MKFFYLEEKNTVINLDKLKAVIPNVFSEDRWRKRSTLIFKYYNTEEVSIGYGLDNSYERSTTHYQDRMQKDFESICKEIGLKDLSV